MFPGANGFSPIPRKIAGSAMITMEPSKAAISTPRVVLDSATHLYRSGTGVRATVVVGLTAAPPLSPVAGPRDGQAVSSHS